MLCWFLLHSEMNQLYVYMYPPSPDLFFIFIPLLFIGMLSNVIVTYCFLN